MSRHDSRPRGWYPDPALSDRFRFWDGIGWTGLLSNSAQAALPPSGGVRVVPRPSRRPAWIWAVAFALAAALLVGIAMSVSGVVALRRQAGVQTSGWSVPGQATTQPASRLEPTINGSLVSFGSATVRLPESPFSGGRTISYSARAIFTGYVISEVPEARGSTPLATAVIMGRLTEQVDPDQVQTGAGVNALRMANQLFSKVKDAKIGPPAVEPVTRWGAAHPASRATVLVTTPGAAQPARVVLTMVLISPNNWLGWFETDAGSPTAEQTKARQAALDSLRWG